METSDTERQPPGINYEEVGRTIVGYAHAFLDAVEALESARAQRVVEVRAEGKRVVDEVTTVNGTPVIRDHRTREVIGRVPWTWPSDWVSYDDIAAGSTSPTDAVYRAWQELRQIAWSRPCILAEFEDHDEEERHLRRFLEYPADYFSRRAPD